MLLPPFPGSFVKYCRHALPMATEIASGPMRYREVPDAGYPIAGLRYLVSGLLDRGVDVSSSFFRSSSSISVIFLFVTQASRRQDMLSSVCNALMLMQLHIDK